MTKRSLTIYKDNFAVIKEPIIWNLKSGSNTASFSNISKNLLFDSPVLNIEGVQILSQTLNKNFSSTDSFLKNSIGSPVEVIPTSGSRTEGLLMDINSSSISVKTSKGLVVFQRSQLLSITLKSNSIHDKFAPEIVWELASDEDKSINAELTYITSGFSWKPIYTLTINGDDSKATLDVNAEISNNTNVSLFATNISVVEGNVPLQSKSKSVSYQMIESRNAMDNRSALGDFYIFDIGLNMKLDSMQSVQLPLMDQREITYDKKYVFQNSERDQGDEPLSVEVSFENSASESYTLWFWHCLLYTSPSPRDS